MKTGKGKGANHLTRDAEGISYLGATNRNNAVLDFVERDEKLVQKGNCIAFIRNGEGSIGYAVYKSEDFISTSDITLGYASFLNEYTGMFITTVADKVRGKYSYNYKRSEERLRKEILQLPVDDSGQPDWPFMEEYMRERERLLLERYSRENKDECERVTLDSVTWGEFLISELFTISPGVRLIKENMIPGDMPYVGASAFNNGVTAFVSNVNASMDSEVLGVNYDGSVVENFYHPYTCLFSDSVKRFRLKAYDGNKYVYLFVKACILQQKSKYNYGYTFNEARMRRQAITLPIDEHGKPDYIFMEKFMRSHERRLVRLYMSHLQVKLRTTPPPKLLSLEGVKWRTVYLRDIFSEIQRGRRLKTADHVIGNVPYVSSSAVNNGVDDFVGNDDGVRKFSNCMTIANSGSVGKTFFHEYEFVASDHVTALKSHALDKYVYMFIVSVAERLGKKYSFNREINEARINREKIILPVDEFGNPDYEFMREYSRWIEDERRFEALAYFSAKLEGRA